MKIKMANININFRSKKTLAEEVQKNRERIIRMETKLENMKTESQKLWTSLEIIQKDVKKILLKLN